VHELGLLSGVVSAVTAAATAAGATAVERVGLRVGTRSAAVPTALTDAWPIATAGTPLAGARLDIEVVEAAVWCPQCQAERVIDDFFDLTCPVCGTPTATLVRGREFAVTYADLTDPAG